MTYYEKQTPGAYKSDESDWDDDDNPERSGDRPTHSRRGLAVTALLLVALGGSVAGLILNAHAEKGGDKDAQALGEFNSRIKAVHLQEGARIRTDPRVENGERSNVVEVLGQPETVLVDGTRVYYDEANGNWYALTDTNLRKANPNFNSHGDKDGVLWVNEAKASAEEDTSQ